MTIMHAESETVDAVDRESVSQETVAAFQDIARKAARLAINNPKPSAHVSWFMHFVRQMTSDLLTSGCVNIFLQAFPDSTDFSYTNQDQFLTQEALVENVCDRIEAVVNSWKASCPHLNELIVAYLEKFAAFQDIAREAVRMARSKSNLSADILWFMHFVEHMDIVQDDTRIVGFFLEFLPDGNFSALGQFPTQEAVVEEVCSRLAASVAFWKVHSPSIRNLIAAYENNLAGQAAKPSPPAIEAPIPAAEPDAGVGEPVQRQRRKRRTRRTRTPRAHRSIIFRYTFISDQAAIQKLDEYVKIGKLIRSRRSGFTNSNLWHFERFLSQGRPAIDNYLGRNSFWNARDTLGSAFYAIAAPSMEGKTQSAFVFRAVKPLYFVMPKNKVIFQRDDARSQSIYQNFKSLSMKLARFSRKDVRCLKKRIRIREYEDNFEDTMYSGHPDFRHYISAAALFAYHHQKKFYVLGFIKALILDARSNHTDASNIIWMEYYVKTDRILNVRPVSISDMYQQGLTDGFFLFLDEFTGTLPNLFVRNIARASGIKVVVANTNTNVAEFICLQQDEESCRDVDVWAVVLTKLNNLNEDLYLRMVPDFVTLRDDLYRKVTPQDLASLKAFMNNFLKFQTKKLRPGFVHLIFEAMKEFNQSVTNDPFSLNDLLCNIVEKLEVELTSRKPLVKRKITGQIGTKALYFGNAYGPVIGNDELLRSHRKEYLNHHYYYLINPVDTSKFCFLTYPPEEPEEDDDEEESTDESLDEGESYLSLYLEGNPNRTDEEPIIEWKPELTIFEKDEVLPFLAFLGIWHNRSIFSMLHRASVIADASGLDISNTRNISQPVRMNGNALEVLSTVCSINASHRNLNSSRMTFTGQSGKDFLANLIKNLIYANGCRIRPSYEVVFPTNAVIGSLLDRIHVPFLFPSNLPIPSAFWKKFSACAQFFNRSIHVGNFERTRDSQHIDCKFDIFVKHLPLTGTARNPDKKCCCLECKNWDGDVGLTVLRGIFEKAQSNGAKLSLLICNSVVESFNEDSQVFLTFKQKCIEEKWQVLKVVQRMATTPRGKIFAIEPFHPSICLPNPEDYSMICIVIELVAINAQV